MKFMNSLEEYETIYMMMPKKFQFEFLLLYAEKRERKRERNYGKISPGDEKIDDLKAIGYEMLDKKVGLTLTQTKLALSKLAKFHAASSIRHQKVIIFCSHHCLPSFN